MSRTARFGSTTSLLALCAVWPVLLAHGEEAVTPPAVVVVGYVPDPDPAIDAALRRGIERAFAAASARGERRLELRVGRKPAQWSNAGPETVRLVFAERAQALISPSDRRIAHLMAQVATRVRVALVSTCRVRSVGQTGSTWVHDVAGEEAGDAPPDWQAIGERAGRRAAALLPR